MYDIPSILTGLENLFQFKTLMFLCFGFALGFIVGAIPGFNDANLMAILLPFTLLLDPTLAIVTMTALYFAAQAAGSIPAILINVPGTGGTAASTLEGYPMSRQGKSGLALGLSLGASTVGAFFGAAAALVLRNPCARPGVSQRPVDDSILEQFVEEIVDRTTASW